MLIVIARATRQCEKYENLNLCQNNKMARIIIQEKKSHRVRCLNGFNTVHNFVDSNCCGFVIVHNSRYEFNEGINREREQTVRRRHKLNFDIESKFFGIHSANATILCIII